MFYKNGSVTNKKRSVHSKDVNTDENKENVRTSYQNAPSTSSVCASLQMHIPCTSLWRVMKHIQLKIWRPCLPHEMNDDNYDWQVQFCDWLQQLQGGIEIMDRII